MQLTYSTKRVQQIQSTHLTDTLNDCLIKHYSLKSLLYSELSNVAWAYASLGVLVQTNADHFVQAWIERSKKSPNKGIEVGDLVKLLWSFACADMLNDQVVVQNLLMKKATIGDLIKSRDSRTCLARMILDLTCSWRIMHGLDAPLPPCLETLNQDGWAESLALSKMDAALADGSGEQVQDELVEMGFITQAPYTTMEGIRVDALAISPIDGRASVIVIHRPWVDLLSNDDHLNGAALLRHRMLLRTGLNLVEIDAREWAKLDSVARKTLLAPKLA